MSQKISTEQKLKERCEILESVIQAVSAVYHNVNTSQNQKDLVETIIGAAIWYFPHSEKYWTGKISKEAKEALIKDCKTKLTKEHQYPRKIAGRDLLNTDFEKVSLIELYEEKYAKYNLVTPGENKRMVQYQRGDVFTDIESAYKAAGIELIDITKEEIKLFKKGVW